MLPAAGFADQDHGAQPNPAQRELLLSQAQMIYLASEESAPEPADRDDVRRAYEDVLEAATRLQGRHDDVLDQPASRSAPSAGQMR